MDSAIAGPAVDFSGPYCGIWAMILFEGGTSSSINSGLAYADATAASA